MNYTLSYEIFIGMHIACLLGGEFANCYGQGKTPEDAVDSLKLRVIQLRNIKKHGYTHPKNWNKV